MASSPISLSKALKYRKRVQSAIKRVSDDIQFHNTVMFAEGKTPVREVDPKALMTRLDLLVEHLIDLENRLNAANIPIQQKIIRLRELKGRITFLKHIRTDHGPQNHYRLGGESIMYSDAVYRKTDIDEMVRKAEMEIDTIQDELDAFNATTKIDLPNFGIINQR